MKKCCFFLKITHLTVLTLFLAAFTLFAQRPILDENGNETGMMNMNPDPNGEPWIVSPLRPLTPEELEELNNLPALKVDPRLKKRALPSEVNNTKEPEFPPVFNQIGGSCGQASSISYIYTYEANLLTGVTGTKNNQRAYGFTHNFLNGGDNGNGSWQWDGWNIVKQCGVITVEDFNGQLNGGLSGTYWNNGYDGYHNANYDRVKDYFEIDVSTESGINDLKQWMYDHANGSPKGGVVAFTSNVSYSYTTISSGPHQGEKLCTTLGGPGTAHAMTLAGYSDDIPGGAFLLLNTWGTGWNDGGMVWLSKDAVMTEFYQGKVWGIHVEKHTPKLECKAVISSSSRNKIKITTGFAGDASATDPTSTETYNKAFNYCGGSLPMEGNGGSSEIEIGLDASRFYDMITGDAKIFLIINSNGGSGTVKSFSVLDYSAGAVPTEFVCKESNVAIKSSGQTLLSVVLSSKPRITVVSPNGGEEIEQHSTTTIKWGDNIDDNVKIELLKGGAVLTTVASSTESDGSYDWVVPDTLSVADNYSIRITSTVDNSLSDESDADFSVTKEYIVENFPFVVDFDDLDTGTGVSLGKGWSQLSNDDIDWTVWNGATPSKVGSAPNVTGPDNDHTTGSGNYVYVEASNPNNPGKVATIETPKLDLESMVKSKMSFWCHMFSDSNQMGNLYIDVSDPDGRWTESVKTVSGDHGDEWFLVEQDLTNFAGKRVKIRFRGETGESWASDICIDDIRIESGTSISSVAVSDMTNGVRQIGSKLYYSTFNGVNNSITFSLYNLKGALVLKKNFAGVHLRTLPLVTEKDKLSKGTYIYRINDGVKSLKSVFISK